MGIPIALGISKQSGPLAIHSRTDLDALRTKMSAFLRAGTDCLVHLRNELHKVIAEEVGVREISSARAHITALAEKARDDVADYALMAFMQRSCDGKRDTTQWIDSLASLLGGRALESWHDDTVVRFRAELRRVYTLLSRVVALSKFTNKKSGPDHAVVAVHVVDQKGRERYVAVPADAQGALQVDDMSELRAALDRLPVPAYALARLLLEYSVELSEAPKENAA